MNNLIDFNKNRLTNLGDPKDDYDAIHLACVKKMISGIEPNSDIFLDNHTAFYRIKSRERVFPHVKCATTVLLLPSYSDLKPGDNFWVISGQSGMWEIAQEPNQQICMGNNATTLGTGGSIKSTAPFSSVKITCHTIEVVALFVVDYASQEIQFI